jgi:hypothetical protein
VSDSVYEGAPVMEDPPIYGGLVAELGDPFVAGREIDEFAIRWHAARLRKE